MPAHSPLYTPAYPAGYQKTQPWPLSYTTTGTRPATGARPAAVSEGRALHVISHLYSQEIGMGAGDPPVCTIQIECPREEGQAQHVGHRTV